jgi:hypothetical protein
MKLAIRTFAAALLVTGILASSHSQQTIAVARPFVASHQPLTSLMPAPACPPDDPDGCGIGPVPK